MLTLISILLVLIVISVCIAVAYKNILKPKDNGAREKNIIDSDVKLDNACRNHLKLTNNEFSNKLKQ